MKALMIHSGVPQFVCDSFIRNRESRGDGWQSTEKSKLWQLDNREGESPYPHQQRTTCL